MDPRVGDRLAPAVELAVQVVEIPEGPRQEEVLPDIAERALDLALRFCPVWPTRPRDGVVVVQQRHERSVVGDDASLVLADHRGLHPVIEKLLRHTAHGRERGDVAAHDGLQVLARDEPPPEPPAVAQDDGEQPDLARDAGLVRERDGELGEVYLRLASGRRLEATLEPRACRWPDLPQKIGHPRIAAFVAHIPDLPQQPGAAEIGKGNDTLAQISFIGFEQSVTRLARAIDRRLQPPFEIFPNGLPVAPDLPRNRGEAEPLFLQIVDQDDLPQSMHPSAPVHLFRASGQHPAASPISGYMKSGNRRRRSRFGGFSNGAFGEITSGGYRPSPTRRGNWTRSGRSG